jgi:hypothetical protein
LPAGRGVADGASVILTKVRIHSRAAEIVALR